MPRAQTVAELKLKPDVPKHCIRFREGRAASGLSLDELCEALSISKQGLLQFETNKQRLDLEKFALACKVMHLDVRWVLYGKGTMFDGEPPTSKGGRPARRRRSAPSELNLGPDA